MQAAHNRPTRTNNQDVVDELGDDDWLAHNDEPSQNDRKDHEVADEDVSEDDELGADDDKYAPARHSAQRTSHSPPNTPRTRPPAGTSWLPANVATASPTAINGFLRRQHPGSSDSTYLVARRYAKQWNLPDPDARRPERAAAAGTIETARREQACSTGQGKPTGVLRDLSPPDRP